ncbi:MAG: hypothetical protein KC609_07625 [Myxococcales bacterium]|nr:hypothetical protein [Myxococcales bacterium]
MTRSFLTLSWTPAAIDVQFPAECPHCGAPPTRTVTIDCVQHVGLSSGSLDGTARIVLRVPVCKRMLAPLWLYFLRLVLAAVFIVSLPLVGVALMSGHSLAIAVPLALAVVYGVARYHARWIRFSRFDHRHFCFKIRRDTYALALAVLNRGKLI